MIAASACGASALTSECITARKVSDGRAGVVTVRDVFRSYSRLRGVQGPKQ
jgi:hypothetical protein